MSEELQQLFPTGKEISIRDENLTIKPFKFGELPKVFKAIEPLSDALTNSLYAGEFSITTIAKMIADGGDSVIDLMVIGSRKERGWITDLEMDEGVLLLTSIIEVNADFFTQKVLPQINQKLTKLNGQTSS